MASGEHEHVKLRRTLFKFQYKLHGKVLETFDTSKYLEINLSHVIYAGMIM